MHRLLLPLWALEIVIADVHSFLTCVLNVTPRSQVANKVWGFIRLLQE